MARFDLFHFSARLQLWSWARLFGLLDQLSWVWRIFLSAAASQSSTRFLAWLQSLNFWILTGFFGNHENENKRTWKKKVQICQRQETNCEFLLWKVQCSYQNREFVKYKERVRTTYNLDNEWGKLPDLNLIN